MARESYMSDAGLVLVKAEETSFALKDLINALESLKLYLALELSNVGFKEHKYELLQFCNDLAMATLG